MDVVDAPDEVWVKACDAGKGFGASLVGANGNGAKLAHIAIEIAKRAILAERKRCAGIAMVECAYCEDAVGTIDDCVSPTKTQKNNRRYYNGRAKASRCIMESIEAGT